MMKRTKKRMETMLPRLNVNEKEKGGARGPPRNKMALYEHLTFPSHKFNHGILHITPHTSSTSQSQIQDNSGANDSELKLGGQDQIHDGSETSMGDSVSDLDIFPGDVVRIIGQKHFLKARRAIINQQRLFASQIFELHRLIKVQQLIARSPQILHEDAASPEKLPPKSKLPKYDGINKVNDKMEHSAENAMEKTSLSSSKDGIGNYEAAAEMRKNPWSLQPHQWLIPIMSQSEGLIYKPYLGPGSIGSFSVGLPYLPSGQGDFPPYHMQFLNPNMSTGPAFGYTNQFTGQKCMYDMRYNFLTDQSCGQPKDNILSNHAAPVPQTRRAIKVVPYNPRLATKSAARIFQSIREERKHHESL